MARIGIGRRIGGGFIWTSTRLAGGFAIFLYLCLIVIGVLGIIALIYGAWH